MRARCVAVAALLCTACAPYEVEDTRRRVIQSWADNVLFSAYTETQLALVALTEQADLLCADASPEALANAQLAWSNARAPWKRTEVFAFGPFKEEPLRFGPKIDAWPLRPETVQGVLDDSFEIDGPRVDGLGVFAVGFPAVEYLLFEGDIDVVNAFAADSRRCDYLLTLIDKLDRDVGGLHDAWRPAGGNYLAQLTTAGRESTDFDSLSDALGEVVNRLGFTVENIANDKLSRPLGSASDGTPQPEFAESGLSGRSLDDIRSNLDGIEAMLFEQGDVLALETYLRKRGHYLRATIRTGVDDVRAALAEIDGPLTTAVVDDRDAVASAIEALRRLQRLIQVDVLDALSLDVDFNDTDGD